MDKQAIMDAYKKAVIEGDAKKVVALAEESIAAGISPLQSIEGGLTPGISEVGDAFGRGEMFLPEMVASAEAMEAAMNVLEPHFEGDEAKKKGRVLVGTVKGDIHDIGKNIVIALLKVNGWEVVDLGRDVPSADFVDKAIDMKADVVGISGLLTTSLPMMRDIIQMMVEDEVRDQIKVIIGGGPTSQEFADEIGADGYGDTAYNAIQLCDKIMGL
jgi:corrinoid protein of di/trimethylamine methyltransferase